MSKGKNIYVDDELNAALSDWREAMLCFDSASGDEIRFVALEVEAASQKYVYVLNKRREAYAAEHALTNDAVVRSEVDTCF